MSALEFTPVLSPPISPLGNQQASVYSNRSALLKPTCKFPRTRNFSLGISVGSQRFIGQKFLPSYNARARSRQRGEGRMSILPTEPSRSQEMETIQEEELITYSPGVLDDLFLSVFRGKMVEEVGWDSVKPGYDGLIDVAKRGLLAHHHTNETEQATVRILRSLFPSWFLALFKRLIAPLGGQKPAAMLCAQFTLATCQWLMGPCTVNHVELADGSSLLSGVFVQKCKYLEESKCAGICIHTCKMPTQAFIKGDMGVALAIEPNYENFSCQFKFGVEALPAEEEPALQTPCLAICPTAAARATIRKIPSSQQCPQDALTGLPCTCL